MGTIQAERHRSRQMFVKRILPVFLILVWGAVFNSFCAAAPLMVEKNLFATDRKPPPPESADTPKSPKPAMAIGNIQLDGVIMQSNTKKAVLRMKSVPAGPAVKNGPLGSPFVTVREGQTVSDYRVSKIEAKSITLEKDGQTFVVGLFADNKVVSPASAPPAAAAPVQPQPPSAQVQPGFDPAANQPQPAAGQAPAFPGAPNVGALPAPQRNVGPNVYPPAVNADPNQPVETIEEE